MFSIITPLDSNRLEQFKVTKRIYDTYPQVKEFLIPTRQYSKVYKYLKKHDLLENVFLLPYRRAKGFNVSKALNIGIKNSSYDHIIVTSPEVKPTTNVLDQFEEVLGENIICKVSDEAEDGSIQQVLVYRGFRDDTPAMYFLAMFNKKDIEKINGWDEDFMRGYAYEDNDFGERWRRAGLPWTLREDIEALHQYHPRSETIEGGTTYNMLLMESNTENRIIKPKNGLIKL